ncbi:caspase family protein [Vitiosangium sp. GDMCC 1.1324]|uniref:caspase family protein n=1 Tax=Vitiosangium sp. (strain GDMCC 1.1324) TaxID=2138576 RepID=UPI000D33B265|nr:caspase family protein [Vitiosangium sp. GDMCC 1.1324]PTL83867.1 caspase family protein [Vitiosangium sp. GDMCC 1.1324]
MSLGRASLLCLVLAVLSPLSARALPERTWVVAIGHNDGAPNEVSLLYAEQDARTVADVLREHGRVSSQRTRLLLGEDATTVRRALQEVNASIRAQAGEGHPTALVVFYSGHADAAALHLGGTELPLAELKTLVEGSPAGMRLLVLDACRSGTVTRVKGVTAAESFLITLRDDVATEGLAIITSSAAGEASQESDRLRGSFFTHHLMNALRGAADQDDDGNVTLTEAYAYAYTQTLRSSGQTMALQHPTYSWDVKGRGELVLSKPAESRGRMGLLRLGESALYLIMDGRREGAVVAEVSPQGQRRELSLPAGNYFVQQRKADEYREYQVALAAGGVAELGTMRFETVRYDRLVRRRGGERRYIHNFSLTAGARGQMLAGEGTSPQLQLGYGLDFDWGSVGLRLRGLTVQGSGADGLLPRRHDELGLGLSVMRFVDLEPVSLAFGLFIEGVFHQQRFDTDRLVTDRRALGAGFGGILMVERHLTGGIALRLEGGPVSGLFQHEVGQEAGEVRHELVTPLTWWGAGGIVWRW